MLKAAGGFSHQVLDQWVWIVLKSRENKNKEKKQCRSWNVQNTLHTNLLGKIGVTTHEKTNLLTMHFRTQLGYRKPQVVHSVTVFCNFKSVLVPAPDVSPLIPVPIVIYVNPRAATHTEAHCN